MQHEHRGFCARAFVEKTHTRAARRRERFRREGILGNGNRAHHSSESIKQFRPLPMPSNPTRSPSRTAPASIALVNVAGNATDPVLPNVSNVEKSFARLRPSVS